MFREGWDVLRDHRGAMPEGSRGSKYQHRSTICVDPLNGPMKR